MPGAGLGAVRAPAVFHALDTGVMHDLLLSLRFPERQPVAAGTAVRAALDEHADSEGASVAGAAQCDRDRERSAARLRCVSSLDRAADAPSAIA
jgi:hypothetical protein